MRQANLRSRFHAHYYTIPGSHCSDLLRCKRHHAGRSLAALSIALRLAQIASAGNLQVPHHRNLKACPRNGILRLFRLQFNRPLPNEFRITEYTDWVIMNNLTPKYRAMLLMGVICALSMPYFGFVMYFGSRYPSGHSPAWFTNTLLGWFTANFLIAILVAKRIFRGQVVDPEKARAAREQSAAMTTRLLIVWIALLLLGVAETIQGKIPLARALPAGAFLLFFIGTFAWYLWRAKQAKA